MKINFEEILSVEGVYGAFLISAQGQCLFCNFSPLKDLYINATAMMDSYQQIIELINWPEFVDTLGNIRELELIFEKGKCYFKKAGDGYLSVILEKYAPMGMIRLNCERFILQLVQDKIINA